MLFIGTIIIDKLLFYYAQIYLNLCHVQLKMYVTLAGISKSQNSGPQMLSNQL